MNALDDPQAWLQAQPAADPVSRRVLEGLARRAARQPQGALRERLVARLVERAQAHASTPASTPALSPRTTAAASPLAELVARLQPGAGPELRNVQLHRRTWSALRLTRRMAEVSAPVPEHLGPLNSQVLVSRALQQLQGLSPDYLQRLLTQLDTLAALAPLQAAAEAEKPVKPTRPAAKRAAPRKR
ncbi:DUF2894 domain-containing protein [Roseateles sp. P5_E7]